jgi:L,D-transpeptidase catalytic domain
MALPSQTERSSSSARAFSSRGSGLSSKTVISVVAVVLVAAGITAVILLRNSSGTPAKSDAAVDPSKAKTASTPPGKTGSISPTAKSDPKSGTKDKPPTTLGGTEIPALIGSPSAGKDSTKGTPPPNSPTPGTSSTGASTTATTPPAGSKTSTPGATTAAPSTGSVGDSGKPAPVDVSSTGTTPTPSGTTGTGSSPTDSTRPPAPTAALPASGSTDDVRSLISKGDDARQKSQLVLARQFYSRALMDPNTARSDQESLRTKLSAINEDLVFSPTVTPGDPLTETYAIQQGDYVSRLPRKRELTTDWRLIKRVNRLSDDDLNRMKVGRKLKLVRGPFHAIVHKGDYRLDLFAGSPDEAENWLFIRSFKVGLGEGDSTPVGSFVIRNRQANPPWTNPRTGQKFDANDPKNPIGEFWLGWEGVGPSSSIKGYGIHGTIEPDSIGNQKSMGCVRLSDNDIAMVFEMLTEKVSVVQVRP